MCVENAEILLSSRVEGQSIVGYTWIWIFAKSIQVLMEHPNGTTGGRALRELEGGILMKQNGQTPNTNFSVRLDSVWTFHPKVLCADPDIPN